MQPQYGSAKKEIIMTKASQEIWIVKEFDGAILLFGSEPEQVSEIGIYGGARPWSIWKAGRDQGTEIHPSVAKILGGAEEQPRKITITLGQ